MWKRHPKTSPDIEPVADNFLDWAASLPFVVERTHGLSKSVRMYEVDCEPLDQRRTWLILDFATPRSPRPTSITVVLPRKVATKAARAEWGAQLRLTTRDEAPASEFACLDRVVFQVNPLAGRRNVENVVLGAYRSIIDWT